MQYSKAFPSKYVSARALKAGGPLRTKIRAVTSDTIFGDPKIVAELDNGQRWTMSATGSAPLAKAFGDDMDAWVDKPIELSVAEIENNGRVIECVLATVLNSAPDSEPAPKRQDSESGLPF
jgi:hypothetical protein